MQAAFPRELPQPQTLLGPEGHPGAAFSIADRVRPQTVPAWPNPEHGQCRGDPDQHMEPHSGLQGQEGDENASMPSSALMDFSTIFYKRSFLFM